MNKAYDLIVVGGGFTGVAAAIAASREGLNVLLVEKSGFLGGSATNCYVNPFMGYWIKDKKTDEDIQINKGIFDTILKKLEEMGGLHKNKLTFNEEYLKIILDRLVCEYGIKVIFHTTLVDVEKENDLITGIITTGKDGIQRFTAKYFIDTSGDANLAAIAGCPYQLGRKEDNLCQPMTLCFRLANVDIPEFEKIQSKINPLYKEMQNKGEIKNPRENVLIFPHMSDGVLHFNSTRIVKRSPINTEDVSIAEMQAREQVLELYRFLKSNFDCFKNSTLIMSAPEIGVRESRMIEGDYIIQAEDLLSCVKFEDSIARGSYSIDIHSPDGSGTIIKHIEKGEYYTIPYRALIPKGVSNLLVAGRCISSTHEAQSAYRIMPICCCIGEGVGIAIGAAFADNTGTRNVPMDKIHKLMDKYNALY